MKMNGFVRIGIVLTIIWIVAAGLYTRNEDVARAQNFADLSYKVCTNTKTDARNGVQPSCEVEKEHSIATWMEGSNGNVAFAALAPIPVGWLVGFILVYAWRIFVAGFRTVVPWNQLSRPKKTFAAFCALFIFSALTLGAVNVMNLYVDTKVPVALSSFLDVTASNDDYVHVAGTWTRRGRTEKSGMGYPLQTSTINCSREERRCIEARAEVSGNVLMSELVEYKITLWSKGSVVMKLEDLCYEEIFTIDLNTKAVTGAGKRTNVDTPFCKMTATGETEWTYRMEGGFGVYWGERKKARPALLRIVQSFFGN